MWFDRQHLSHKNIIKINDLHGYVLPHAGTEFTGTIISHTLRFRPARLFKQVVILYYPASKEPDIVEGEGENLVKYYHEIYVPWKSMDYIFNTKTISYTGYNIGTDKIPAIDLSTTLIVVSADFSHFMPFQKAIDLENKAAHALMFKELLYSQVVDDLKTFKVLFDIIPTDFQLQWVGRERSSGEKKAVGYLSFLLRETPKIKQNKIKPNGMFVTVYSKDMVARECRGKWFDTTNWSLDVEKQLKDEVILLGETTSRLTSGFNIETPLTHYSITYLYKDNRNPFIRGWHGILHHAFYLPDVFLENTFNNGEWIHSNHTKWINTNTNTNTNNTNNNNNFNLTETLNQLKRKAGIMSAGARTRARAKAGARAKTFYTKFLQQYSFIKKGKIIKKKTIKKKKYGGNGNETNPSYTLYSSSVEYHKV